MKQSPPLEAPRVDSVHDPIEAKVNSVMPPAHHKLTDGPFEANPDVSLDKNTLTDRPKSFAEIQWVVPPKGVRAWNKARRMYEQDHSICDPPDYASVDHLGSLFTIPDSFDKTQWAGG